MSSSAKLPCLTARSIVMGSVIVGDTARIVCSLPISSSRILTAPVTIGEGCLLGAGSITLPGAVLDSNVTLSPLAVADLGAHFPSKSICMGSPAKVVKVIHLLEHLQKQSNQLINQFPIRVPSLAKQYGIRRNSCCYEACACIVHMASLCAARATSQRLLLLRPVLQPCL